MTDFEHPSVVLCPAGPLLLRGEHAVLDAEGTVHHTTRPVSAVCMCGRSGIQPWCDSTHRLRTDVAGERKETNA